MTRVHIYKTETGAYTGFLVEGHAEYADPGEDIVCSAISLLTINTVNAIGQFTEDQTEVEEDQTKGMIRCMLQQPPSHDTELLLRSFELGVTELAKQYKEVSCLIEQKG